MDGANAMPHPGCLDAIDAASEITVENGTPFLTSWCIATGLQDETGPPTASSVMMKQETARDNFNINEENDAFIMCMQSLFEDECDDFIDTQYTTRYNGLETRFTDERNLRDSIIARWKVVNQESADCTMPDPDCFEDKKTRFIMSEGTPPTKPID